MPFCIKKTLLDIKSQININKIIMRVLNTSLSQTDQLNEKNYKISELNQVDSSNKWISSIYRVVSSTTAEYVFFTAAHRRFSKRKVYLYKCKRIRIIPSVLSDHSAMKLKIKGKKIHRNYANVEKWNNALLNN